MSAWQLSIWHLHTFDFISFPFYFLFKASFYFHSYISKKYDLLIRPFCRSIFNIFWKCEWAVSNWYFIAWKKLHMKKLLPIERILYRQVSEFSCVNLLYSKPAIVIPSRFVFLQNNESSTKTFMDVFNVQKYKRFITIT